MPAVLVGAAGVIQRMLIETQLGRVEPTNRKQDRERHVTVAGFDNARAIERVVDPIPNPGNEMAESKIPSGSNCFFTFRRRSALFP